ncbi:MAG: SPW repeat protein [Bauldia sp.]
MDKSRLRFAATAAFVAGIVLWLAPLVLTYTDHTAPSVSSWAAGIAAGIIATAAVGDHGRWAPWPLLVVGVYAVAAPFIVNFTDVPEAMWTHIAVGIVIVLAAITAILDWSRAPPHAASDHG